MHFDIRLFISSLLLIAATLPPLHGLSDSMLAPKWYAAILASLTAACIMVWRRAKNIHIPDNAAADENDSLSAAALVVLALNMVYVLVADVAMPLVHGMQPRYLHGVFDNPTGLAMNLCLLMAMALRWLMPGWHGGWRRKAAWGVWMAAAVVQCMSGCRTGMICMVMMGIYILWQYIRSRRWRWAVAICLVVAASAGALMTKTESTSGRTFILMRTWELIREQPLTGYGPHGFSREYMPHQAEYFREHPDSVEAWLADDISHPLNEFIYLWTDFGVVAPMLLACLLLLPFILHRRTHDRRLGQMLPAVMVVTLFALTAYPHLYPMPWLVMAMTYMTAVRNEISRHWHPGRLMAATMTAACIVLTAFTIWHTRYEHRWYKLDREVRQGHSAATLLEYDSLYTHYSSSQRFIYSMMFAQFQARHFASARDTYSRLSHLCRTYDMELLMGDIYRHDRRPWRALPHYREAHYMVPVRFAPLAGMMDAYAAMGDTLHADSMARVILAKPVKVPSPQIDEMKRRAEGRLKDNPKKFSNQ